ncbi:chromatin structure-remodeling complex subunit RSC7 [Malassezia sp. CBS 17886]|nr:chromatin structure-remodeling complex subunit RSC7 [Malassezia sp. CBS 17886]
MLRTRRRTRREATVDSEPKSGDELAHAPATRRVRLRTRRAPTPARDASDEDEDATYSASDDAAPRRARRGRGRRAPSVRADTDTGADSAEVDEADGDEGGAGVEGGDGTEGGAVVHVDGREYTIADDALVLDEDPAGETKVDRYGRLQGGRTYRVPTVTTPFRSDPQRLYMLSIDVARSLGFRDSAYFFRKHPLLHKSALRTEERDLLVAEGRLPAPSRARNITMVSARSVFQLVGARIITRGRMVVDDYYEAEARRQGRREGAPVAMPSIEDMLRAERRRDGERERERGRRRADAATHTTIDPHGEAVVTVFGDAGNTPFERAGSWVQRRHLLQRADLTEENWIAQYARSAAAMNMDLAEWRHERLVAYPAPVGTPAVRDADPLKEDADEHLFLDDRPPWERASDTMSPAARAAAKRAAQHRRTLAMRERQPAVGVYEPHTNRMHPHVSTQPTRAFVEKCDEVPHWG